MAEEKVCYHEILIFWKFLDEKVTKLFFLSKKITLSVESKNQKSKTYKSCLIVLSLICMFYFFDILTGEEVLFFFDINIFFEKWNFLGGKIRKHGKWAKSKNPPQYLCACSFYLTFKTSLAKKYWELREVLNFWKKNSKSLIFYDFELVG